MYISQLSALIRYYDKTNKNKSDHPFIHELKLFIKNINTKDDPSYELTPQEISSLYLHFILHSSIDNDEAAGTVFEELLDAFTTYGDTISCFSNLPSALQKQTVLAKLLEHKNNMRIAAGTISRFPKNLITEANFIKLLSIDNNLELSIVLSQTRNLNQEKLDRELQKYGFLSKVEKTKITDNAVKYNPLRFFVNYSSAHLSSASAAAAGSRADAPYGNRAIEFPSTMSQGVRDIYRIYRRDIQVAVSIGIQEFFNTSLKESTEFKYQNDFQDFVKSIMENGISEYEWDKYIAPSIAKHVWRDILEIRNCFNNNSNNSHFYHLIDVTRQEISDANLREYLLSDIVMPSASPI